MNNITEEQYLETVGQLKHLAMTLPPEPTDEEIASFMALEDVANAYEAAQDTRAGLVTFTIEIDERVWFSVCRVARRNGMATNDYLTRIIERKLDMESNSQKTHLVETDEGMAVVIPEEMIRKIGGQEGDEWAIDHRGDGFILLRTDRAENDAVERKPGHENH